MNKKDIVFSFVLAGVIFVGTHQIISLRAEVAQHQVNLDRLNIFVEAQAEALTFCQNAMTGMTE